MAGVGIPSVDGAGGGIVDGEVYNARSADRHVIGGRHRREGIDGDGHGVAVAVGTVNGIHVVGAHVGVVDRPVCGSVRGDPGERGSRVGGGAQPFARTVLGLCRNGCGRHSVDGDNHRDECAAAAVVVGGGRIIGGGGVYGQAPVGELMRALLVGVPMDGGGGRGRQDNLCGAAVRDVGDGRGCGQRVDGGHGMGDIRAAALFAQGTHIVSGGVGNIRGVSASGGQFVCEGVGIGLVSEPVEGVAGGGGGQLDSTGTAAGVALCGDGRHFGEGHVDGGGLARATVHLVGGGVVDGAGHVGEAEVGDSLVAGVLPRQVVTAERGRQGGIAAAGHDIADGRRGNRLADGDVHNGMSALAAAVLGGDVEVGGARGGIDVDGGAGAHDVVMAGVGIPSVDGAGGGIVDGEVYNARSADRHVIGGRHRREGIDGDGHGVAVAVGTVNGIHVVGAHVGVVDRPVCGSVRGDPGERGSRVGGGAQPFARTVLGLCRNGCGRHSVDGDNHRDECAAAAVVVGGGRIIGGGGVYGQAPVGELMRALLVGVPMDGGGGRGRQDNLCGAAVRDVGDGRGCGQRVDGGGDAGTCGGASLSVLCTHIVSRGASDGRGVAGTCGFSNAGVVREIPVVGKAVVRIVDSEADLSGTAARVACEGWRGRCGRFRDRYLSVAGTTVQRAGD